MPRKARLELEAGVHHVYARGNGQQPIYLGDADRLLYLRLLGHVVVRQQWRCLAYCLMPNHVHLLVETREPNLGAGMGRLHGSYAQMFNARHARSGHLFQGRFGSVTMRNDEQLLWAARYVVRNPVEAWLCDEPGDWAWSSHAATLEGRAPQWLDTPRLLAYFGADGGDPRRRYADFVELR
jgi:putative transposase